MNFDYSKIPDGYYDKIFHGKKGMRRFWHYHKFESVLRFVPPACTGEDKAILDIGCFAGSFLGMVPQSMFGTQLGVDILESQIKYAQKAYGTPWRQFKPFKDKLDLPSEFKEKFHLITLIEVIEHLNADQIRDLVRQISYLLHPEGRLILTTPNYISIWPILECMLNAKSDVSYEEQHITKFTYFNLETKFKAIVEDADLECEGKTSTHFLSPFVAAVSYSTAEKMAQAIPGANWKNPFGCIILSRWEKSSSS